MYPTPGRPSVAVVAAWNKTTRKPHATPRKTRWPIGFAHEIARQETSCPCFKENTRWTHPLWPNRACNQHGKPNVSQTEPRYCFTKLCKAWVKSNPLPMDGVCGLGSPMRERDAHRFRRLRNKRHSCQSEARQTAHRGPKKQITLSFPRK